MVKQENQVYLSELEVGVNSSTPGHRAEIQDFDSSIQPSLPVQPFAQAKTCTNVSVLTLNLLLDKAPLPRKLGS